MVVVAVAVRLCAGALSSRGDVIADEAPFPPRGDVEGEAEGDGWMKGSRRVVEHVVLKVVVVVVVWRSCCMNSAGGAEAEKITGAGDGTRQAMGAACCGW